MQGDQFSDDARRQWLADTEAKRETVLKALSTETDPKMQRRLQASARRYKARYGDRSARRREQATRAMPTVRKGRMSEPAQVFEDRMTPGQWRVEWFDDDGRCEIEIFTGPEARRQALRFAMRKYGHFQEVQLEPYPTGGH